MRAVIADNGQETEVYCTDAFWVLIGDMSIDIDMLTIRNYIKCVS